MRPTIVLLALLAAVMVAAAAGVSRWIVLSGFEQVERRHVHAEVQHAQKLVAAGADDLASRLRVLYISGYAASVLPKLLDLEPSEAFLQKPFAGDTLIEKVNALLER